MQERGGWRGGRLELVRSNSPPRPGGCARIHRRAALWSVPDRVIAWRDGPDRAPAPGSRESTREVRDRGRHAVRDPGAGSHRGPAQRESDWHRRAASAHDGHELDRSVSGSRWWPRSPSATASSPSRIGGWGNLSAAKGASLWRHWRRTRQPGFGPRRRRRLGHSPLERDLRQPLQPRREVPVPVAEQLHRRRQQDGPD
jgi:hypothetical protein